MKWQKCIQTKLHETSMALRSPAAGLLGCRACLQQGCHQRRLIQRVQAAHMLPHDQAMPKVTRPAHPCMPKGKTEIMSQKVNLHCIVCWACLLSHSTHFGCTHRTRLCSPRHHFGQRVPVQHRVNGMRAIGALLVKDALSMLRARSSALLPVGHLSHAATFHARHMSSAWSVA